MYLFPTHTLRWAWNVNLHLGSTCSYGISWGPGRCSGEHRPQEAPAEAPGPAETPTPTPAPAPAEEAPAPEEIPAEAPAQYPSERLVQATSEENQIPSHLPTCPSLRHIAGLRGSAVLKLFHSSLAEVAPGLEEGSTTALWAASGSGLPLCWLFPTAAVHSLEALGWPLSSLSLPPLQSLGRPHRLAISHPLLLCFIDKK